MDLIECRACGSKELIQEGAIIVCSFCQSKYSSPEIETPKTKIETPKTEFDVILQNYPEKRMDKFHVLQGLHELTGLGMRDLKNLVESTPRPVLKGVNGETAENAKALLERAGAVVSIE